MRVINLPSGVKLPAETINMARERGVLAGYAIGLATGLVFALLAYGQGDRIGYARGSGEGIEALVAFSVQVSRDGCRAPLSPADRPGRR